MPFLWLKLSKNSYPTPTKSQYLYNNLQSPKWPDSLLILVLIAPYCAAAKGTYSSQGLCFYCPLCLGQFPALHPVPLWLSPPFSCVTIIVTISLITPYKMKLLPFLLPILLLGFICLCTFYHLLIHYSLVIYLFCFWPCLEASWRQRDTVNFINDSSAPRIMPGSSRRSLNICWINKGENLTDRFQKINFSDLVR